MRTLLITSFIILSSFVSINAYANDCEIGEFEIGIEHELGTDRGEESDFDYHGNPEYSSSRDRSRGSSFSLTWSMPLTSGLARSNCEADIAESRAKRRHEDAKARTANAKALQEEAKALRQKIQLCIDFELATAPASIKDYCGDLLQ